MTDQLIQSIVTFFQDKIPNELTVFIISVLPVLELRGGLVAAKLLDMNIIRAFIVCYLGNMLPIPFILLLFLRKIFDWMRKSKRLGKIVGKLEHKAEKHRKTIDKYGAWGLLVLVAIPLPGTGGWTGALVASLLDMRLKSALPAIAMGVAVAGFIVMLATFGVISVGSFLG